MRQPFEQKMLSMPLSDWEAEQVVVFDWYDGPREGVCILRNPKASFFFQLLDERGTEDDLDDRVFGISLLPDATVEKILSLLSDLGEPAALVWSPVWVFSNEQMKKHVEQELAHLLARRSMAAIVIHSRNMKEFLGCWNVDWNSAKVDDWFSFLGIV